MTGARAPTLALFAAFPPHRILFEDASVVVIDKPFGLSTHAADEGRHDDVLSWLGAHYRARGESAYLGTHQRLDRDTSGVLLFSRRKEANPALARQFEGRDVKKTYAAVVEGRVPERLELAHFIRAGEGGAREARARKGQPKRGEQEAVTELRTLQRAGRRALVELTPKTGRTHQLRVQMAAAGAPIVGDTQYQGEPDTRLMLHAHELSLQHPDTGQPLRVEAPIPADLSRALAHESAERGTSQPELERTIREACERRYGVVAAGDTNALRVVHAEGDGMPGVTIDLYGEHAVISLYEEVPEEHLRALVAATIAVGAAGVYAKFRPKHASRIVDSRKQEIAPPLPLAGSAAPPSFEIVEAGVAYEVHLADGLSTGLFVDQRENRRRVRAMAQGARVLNLFAYTGSFSVAAALGGARSTTTVDISKTVLDWAGRNLARAGFEGEAHQLVEADIFDFLQRARAKKQAWDVVVLDPPSFSTTKATTFSAESDYAALATLVMSVMAPGGRLLACTNHRGMAMVKLRRLLHEASRAAKRELSQMKSLPPPIDFPPPPGEEPHLKSVLVTLG